MTRGAKADVAFADAIGDLVAERFRDLWEALPRTRDAGDPEAVHDVRVASRRLRAAMDVGVDCFPRSWFSPLHRFAKDVTSRLGEVRDREVLLADLAKLREGAPPEEAAGIERLLARLTGELEAARRGMEVFLAEVESTDMVEESVRRFGKRARPRSTARAEA